MSPPGKPDPVGANGGSPQKVAREKGEDSALLVGPPGQNPSPGPKMLRFSRGQNFVFFPPILGGAPGARLTPRPLLQKRMRGSGNGVSALGSPF